MTHCLVSMATVSNRRLLTSHDAQKTTLELQLCWEDVRMCVCMFVRLYVCMYLCTCMYVITMYVCTCMYVITMYVCTCVILCMYVCMLKSSINSVH